MNNKKICITALFVALIVSMAYSTAFADQLVIPGTGANEVILQELAAAFNAENPEHEVIIPPSIGSGGGIRLVNTRKSILARVARKFKAEELHEDLQYLPFAKDMIVFAVGPEVGVKNLTSQQLADVFSGKVDNWQQVGGKDQRVRLLIREPEDSSLLVIREKLESFKDITFSDKAKVLFHDFEMVNALNKYSTVIGWLTNSSMKEVSSAVTVITINNSAPTQENVYDGTYVLTGEYALVYNKGKLNELARKFMNYVFSRKGSRILVDNGLVPVNQDQY